MPGGGMRATLTQRNGGFAAIADRVAAKAPQAVTTGAYQLADKVRGNIRSRAYDTGRLYGSTDVEPAGRSAVAAVNVGEGLDYSNHVENGTIYIWPRRYFGDAVAAYRNEFGRHIATELQAVIG